MLIKNEATITVFACLTFLFLMLPCVSAIEEVISCDNAEILNASKYTIPSNEEDVSYGSWQNILTRDGSCTPQNCWGVGINDPVNVTGNDIFKEFNFDITQTEIKELVFNFDACWGGGQNGCGHDDHPEYSESDPGVVQAELYNGSSWIALGSTISIGDIGSSTAMQLTNYSKRINFTNAFLDSNNQTKVRIKTTGTFFGDAYDVEMYTDYAELQVCYVADKIGALNITVEDESEELNVTLELKGKSSYNKKGKKHKTNASLGEYDINITPPGKLKQLLVKNFNHNKDGKYKIIIIEPVSYDWVQAFAIDISELNASGIITAEAAGDKLYACDDWNFTSSDCDSGWTPVQNLTREQEYNVTFVNKKCFKERKNYNISKIKKTGVSKLGVDVDNASIEITDMFTGLKQLIFKSGDNILFYFTHDFDESDINLSNIKLVKTSNAFVVDLGGQEANGTSKTMFFEDPGYNKLCVKNAPIDSPSDISNNCQAADEINFDSCVGNSTGVTINGVTCYDEGTRFRIENLTYSGIRGKKTSSSSSGGGGSSGGTSGTPACNDGEDNDNDGLIDLADPGCGSNYDRNEFNYPIEETETTTTTNTEVQIVEPIEVTQGGASAGIPVITGDTVLAPEEDQEPLELEEPSETIIKTKKLMKMQYGKLSILSLLISLIVVFFLLRRDKRTVI